MQLPPFSNRHRRPPRAFLIFGTKNGSVLLPPRQFYHPSPLPIKHLKGLSYPKWLAKRAINAQLPDRVVVGHRVITFTALPFKTRLFMYSHFAAFMVSGASVKAATIKSSMAHASLKRVAKKQNGMNWFCETFFFLFSRGEHPRGH